MSLRDLGLAIAAIAREIVFESWNSLKPGATCVLVASALCAGSYAHHWFQGVAPGPSEPQRLANFLTYFTAFLGFSWLVWTLIRLSYAAVFLRAVELSKQILDGTPGVDRRMGIGMASDFLVVFPAQGLLHISDSLTRFQTYGPASYVQPFLPWLAIMLFLIPAASLLIAFALSLGGRPVARWIVSRLNIR